MLAKLGDWQCQLELKCKCLTYMTKSPGLLWTPANSKALAKQSEVPHESACQHDIH